jgi:predicted glutamine amidotransferase
MCGIGGIVRCKSRPIEESQISSLLLGLESRGYEASGVAIVNDDNPEPQVYKNDDSATVFVGTVKYTDFLKKNLSTRTRIVLAHTRLSTGQALPSDNANNHPLFNGVSAVIHNGCLNNDDELFVEKSLERKAKTDSDIIRAIADQEGLTRKGVRELAKISGSVAAAIINKNYPNHLLLLRSGNPLVIGNSSDYIIFASTKKAVAIASKQWFRRHGMWVMRAQRDIDYSVFPSDSAELIGPNTHKPSSPMELLWHQEFKCAPYTHNPRFFSHWMAGADDDCFWPGYGNGSDACGYGTAAPTKEDREKFYNDAFGPKEQRKVIICPHKACGTRLTVPKYSEKTPLTRLTCSRCKGSLEGGTVVWTSSRNAGAANIC